MNVDDPVVLDVLRRCMVARMSTLSGNGRPNLNPLYFVYQSGQIWLGTSAWTLAARNVLADPRVSILFEVEQDRSRHQILRISGHASLRTDPKIQRSYNLRVARKYVLTAGGLRHYLVHLHQRKLQHTYHAQSAEKGRACVIEVTPLEADFLGDEKLG